MDLNRRATIMLAFCEGISASKRGRILHLLDGKPSRLITELSSALNDLDAVLTKRALSSLKSVFSKDFDVYNEVLDSAGVSCVTQYDEAYPDRLLEISDAPAVLFCKGDVDMLKSNNIAIIGSRYCSKGALRHASTFARELSLGGFNVVSGMARGIDGEAQRACLESGGRTIAVLGSGIDVVYPAESKELYDGVEAHGLIVSEYVPGTPPNHYQFPERNRIISGLSRAVVVIEAGEKSGALITANVAIEQGVDVFVLPSDIDNRLGKGSNGFLKEYPSSLITEPDDVFRALGESLPVTEKCQMALDVMEERIVNVLTDGPKHFDELQEILGLNSNNLNSLLAKMEINGIIIRLVGNEFSI